MVFNDREMIYLFIVVYERMRSAILHQFVHLIGSCSNYES